MKRGRQPAKKTVAVDVPKDVPEVIDEPPKKRVYGAKGTNNIQSTVPKTDNIEASGGEVLTTIPRRQGRSKGKVPSNSDSVVSTSGSSTTTTISNPANGNIKGAVKNVKASVDLEDDDVEPRIRPKRGFNKTVAAKSDSADSGPSASVKTSSIRDKRDGTKNIVASSADVQDSSVPSISAVSGNISSSIDDGDGKTFAPSRKAKAVSNVTSSSSIGFQNQTAGPAQSAKNQMTTQPSQKNSVTITTTKGSHAKRNISVPCGDESDVDFEHEPGPSKKKIIIKGKAPVDEIMPQSNLYHVYCEGDEVYDAALNQTNIGNNNNKFYFIQLLEHDQRKEFQVLTHWGRVGKDGQHSVDFCGSDLEKAKNFFCKKFSDKTKNNWQERTDFQHHSGKYDLIHRDYSAKDEEPADVPDSKEAVKSKPANDEKMPDSSLHPDVQHLIRMIFNLKMMEEQAVEMEYDAKKCPIGRLTTGQITQGYLSLKKIETLLSNPLFNQQQLTDACNEYYTRIPHNFGMRRPTLINDLRLLKKEMDLLELLGDIEIAMRAISDDFKEDMFAVNPIDHRYKGLKIDLTPIDRNSPTFDMIKQYLELTHGPTHTEYSLELLNAFEAKKEVQFKNLENRMLLWHGSRLSNYVGILSQGLRIAPPEAPATGYMFGKGIYFADVSSKSANYCFHHSSEGIGLMLLCEVALGKVSELFEANYNADQLPPGVSATKGVGRHAPDETTYRIMEDGVKVPIGKCVVTQANSRKNCVLDYNEYIVYDPQQVRLRYLCQVKFNEKRGRRY